MPMLAMKVRYMLWVARTPRNDEALLQLCFAGQACVTVAIVYATLCLGCMYARVFILSWHSHANQHS